MPVKVTGNTSFIRDIAPRVERKQAEGVPGLRAIVEAVDDALAEGTCPECGASVVHGVCQSMGCKGRLL